MRVGVIRSDLPGPLFLADLEPTSQIDAPTEPAGQTRYVGRPNALTVGAMLSANIPASLGSTGNITFPLTINAGNQTLLIKFLASAGFTTVLIPTGVYADMAHLVAAMNPVLFVAGFVALPVATNALRVTIMTLVKGAGSYIAYDTTAHGSTANTPLVLAAGGANFTVPTAAAYLAATSPVGGPIDVSASTIRTQLGMGLTVAQVAAAADVIAPKFIETDEAIKSFEVGNISKFLSASYNPDPNRLPALSSSPAVMVVQDDGVSAFVAPVPTLSNAQVNTPGAGQVTLTGTGLAGNGTPNSEVELTKVRFLQPGSNLTLLSLSQNAITKAGGTVSKTSIVIPAALIPASIVAGIKAQVIYTSLASNVFTLV